MSIENAIKDEAVQFLAGAQMSSKKTLVPAGYKRTEVGIIPDDWDAIDLGFAIRLQRGFDLPHRSRRKGDVPIVSSAGVSGFHDEWKVSSPGVVTGRYGTIGQVFFVEENFWPLNTTLYVKDFIRTSPLYTFHFLKTINFESHSGKSGVPGVNRNDLHQEKIAIPPADEQTAIANALSDADALIMCLENLITKKQAIKTATMQQLLTGRTRLLQFRLCEDRTPTNSSDTNGNGRKSLRKGYKSSEFGDIPEDWTIVPLSALVSEHSAGVYKPKSSYGDGVNIVGVGDIYNISKVDGSIYRRVPLSKGERERFSLEVGDLIYGESSLVREGIARTIYVDEGGAGTAFAWHTRRFKVDQRKVDSKFLYYFLDSFVARCHMVNSSITTALTGINTVAYFSCPILLPEKKEQVAIATILSDIEEETRALEQRLTKARQIKQGMIQQLLTGRTRLV